MRSVSVALLRPRTALEWESCVLALKDILKDVGWFSGASLGVAGKSGGYEFMWLARTFFVSAAQLDRAEMARCCSDPPIGWGVASALIVAGCTYAHLAVQV